MSYETFRIDTYAFGKRTNSIECIDLEDAIAEIHRDSGIHAFEAFLRKDGKEQSFGMIATLAGIKNALGRSD